MTYTKFTDEEISICRNTDLVNLCEHLGYKLRKVGSSYQMVDHDSFMISKRKLFMRFSTRDAGSSIDFMMIMEGKSYREAIEYLLDYNGIKREATYENAEQKQHGKWFHVCLNEDGQVLVLEKHINPIHQVAEEKLPEKQPFIMPEKTEPVRVKAYLTKTRRLSEKLVQSMLDEGYVYESAGNHNAVFVGFDMNHVPRHASLRGTYTAEGQKPFKGTVTGSDSRFSFNIFNPDSDILDVFEAPIDALSFMDIFGCDTSSGPNVLALTGVHDRALEQFLKDHINIKTIYLDLDNDMAGEEACKKIMEKYSSGEWAERGFIFHRDILPEGNKDWNEYLVYFRNYEEKNGGIGL